MKENNILTGQKPYTNAKGEKKVYEGEYFPMVDCADVAADNGCENLAKGLEILTTKRGWAGIIRGDDTTIEETVGALDWAEFSYDYPEEIADALEDMDARKSLLLMPAEGVIGIGITGRKANEK